jgi:hypothetical protein
VLGTLRLHAEQGTLLARVLPEAGLTLRRIAQVGAVLASGLFAGICLLGIQGRLRRDREAHSTAGWRLVLGICGAYFAGTIALIATR